MSLVSLAEVRDMPCRRIKFVPMRRPEQARGPCKTRTKYLLKRKKSEKEKAADGRIIGSPLMSSSWPMDCVLRGHALGFSSPIPRASFGNLHYINIRCINILYFCSFPTKLIEILPFFPRCLVVILARCPT